MVPRGSVVLAGGAATATDQKFQLNAEFGKLDFGILSNPYLNGAAKVTDYECTVTADGALYTYNQTTWLDQAESGGRFAHTDVATCRKVN